MPSPLPEAARERLAARARRVALIRRRVVVATLAAFVLAWGVIAYDGPMGTTSKASTRTPTASSTAAGSDTSSSSDDGTSSSGEPAAVTTAQS
jgi:hypothetical protein